MKFSKVTIIAGSIAGANAAALRTSTCPPVDSKGMQRFVTENKLMQNLKDLQTIANWNGGDRAFNSPGYTASVNYIKSQLDTSKTWKSWTQDFEAPRYTVKATFVVEGKSYSVAAFQRSIYVGEDDFTVEGQVVEGPPGPSSCTSEGYNGFDVKDKIVFVDGSDCPGGFWQNPWVPYGEVVSARLRAAHSAGAKAVIVHLVEKYQQGIPGFQDLPKDGKEFGPSGYMAHTDGLHLLSLIKRTNRPVFGKFENMWVQGNRPTQNLFTESIGGDPNNVIMIGAHLDSIRRGPGINDNGSGSSLLITLFHALQKYCPKNRIRLAWWGAEESGLVGSNHYTSNLSKEEADDILLYLNFDMIGRGYFGVFDGNAKSNPEDPYSLTSPPGSNVIEKLFIDYLVANGVSVVKEPLVANTDLAGFVGLNKAVGGLHSGSMGVDSCYHRQCDDYSNINGTHIEIMGKATAHVVSVLSNEGAKLIPKTPARKVDANGRVVPVKVWGKKPSPGDEVKLTVGDIVGV
ncbi:hypothetical protein TWF970_008455 [Orbilia oligospora]|uniref:Peptide hydrolase n=1 Tax=Orbilia oligospora TaxID=2813651 RepID=A0A7C8VL43_ORBOL|nr:hypothetical protein TWF970_008455 [Orbilia oligospora]